MVQFLLRSTLRDFVRAWVLLYALIGCAADHPKRPKDPIYVPELQMDGGRRLTYEGSISSEREVKPKRGFWTRVADVVAGEPDFRSLVRPYSVITDSRGRVIVSDPGAGGIHVFDFKKQAYKFLSREREKDGLRAPQCLAVDARDNIYATDSETGKIFVFEPGGKLQRVIGSLPGGEGFFKRPTGIAIDPQQQRIFVTDTLRDQVFVLDWNGAVLQKIGRKGSGIGEFNFPTELRIHGDHLYVVDAMNFRVQVFDRVSGKFVGLLGQPQQPELFRPKAIGIDSEDHVYIVEAIDSIVRVIDKDDHLLYYFGQKGTGLGDFQMPTGLAIDHEDRIFVVDSFNRRVQVFRYWHGDGTAGGGQ